MKLVRWILVIFIVYVGIVVLFESTLGYFQPEAGSTIVITTTDANRENHERVVASVYSDNQLYVAANHWPRQWYGKALANPSVAVTTDGETKAYTAVPVAGAEHQRLKAENDLGLVFQFLTGFPPRYFLRLDPVENDSVAREQFN